MSKPKHVYLVDGSGYIFRAFHALPPLTRTDGTPVNAVLGFTNMLLKLLDETDADHIAVIFDAGRARPSATRSTPNTRRNRPDAPPELIPQFALIREATRAFNVACIEMDGFEADDLIATYAGQRGGGGRRGHHRLLRQGPDAAGRRPASRMFDPMKNKPIGAAEVQEKFGVAPDKVIDVQALAGDSTDNVPGVPGIGVKTAAELINTYGDLEDAAGARRRDQAAEAAREPARQCRAGAHLARSW